MNTKNLDTGSKDVISLLPREVLGDILSLVPTKLAASTSILSKKWRNVFTLVHNLDFDDSVLLQPEERKHEWDVIRECFRNFVDRTLALQCGSPIKKFSLRYYVDEDSEMAYVAPWLRNALERGVVELNLTLKPRFESFGISEQDINLKTHGDLFLPYEFFMSKTLVKLTMGTKFSLDKLPADLSLPALKSLFIDSISFVYEDLCYVLLPGCPVLEDLAVCHGDFDGPPYCISSQTIKKLSVHYDCESVVDTMHHMSFDAPSLVSLDYSDYALCLYPQVNLASLVQARLDIRTSENIERPDVSGLIEGIGNVETLHLSPDSVDVISLCVRHGLLLPVFNNLINLSFGSKKSKRSWKLLPKLLKQSPKLETLIIQGLDGYKRSVTMLPYQVKELHVLSYRGTAQELKNLKSLLGKTKCIEVLQVDVADTVVDEGIVLQTKRDLMMLLGVSVSSKCQIKVA